MLLITSAITPASLAQGDASTGGVGRKRGILRMAFLAFIVFAVICAWWIVNGWYIEETDDAFIKADSVSISSKIGGYVEEVLVTDNQGVRKGEPLLRLDSRHSHAAIDKKVADIARFEADKAQVQAQIAQLEAQLIQADVQQQAARLAAQHAENEWARYQPLVKTGATTPQQLADRDNARQQAWAQLHALEAGVKAARAKIVECHAEEQGYEAQLQGAKADLQSSNLDLEDTVLQSMQDGTVGDVGVRAGQYIQAGSRLMSIVPTKSIYVIANFKETQVGRMQPNQPVRLHIDAFPGKTFAGHIESLAPATGSEFALLPPENATGNFTKVVQRVPVRIRFDKQNMPSTMMTGLSAKVEVDTRQEPQHHG